MKSLTIHYPDDRQPFWAKCKADGFVWPAAFYPMEVRAIAGILTNSRCPMCGAKGALVASQDAGTLNEALKEYP